MAVKSKMFFDVKQTENTMLSSQIRQYSYLLIQTFLSGALEWKHRVLPLTAQIQIEVTMNPKL